MSHTPDTVVIKKEPDMPQEQESFQKLWITSVSFPGTPQLPPQRFPESPILTSSILTADSEHFISSSALLSILPPSIHKALIQRLSSSSNRVPILLEWRLGSAPFPTIKTRHIITTDSSATNDSHSTNVVFSESMEWAQTIFENYKNFTKVQQRQAAAGEAITGQFKNRRSRSLQGGRDYDPKNCFHRDNCNHSRCPSSSFGNSNSRSSPPAGSGIDRHFSPKPIAPSITTTRGREPSRRKAKPQCTQKLLEALGRHAEQHYKDTGDTSELRRVMELHRRCGVRSVSV
ncbi:hypothetical protein QBC44DRAFT_314284 [Cladorrhinum sp. PSN332]|nr:hypothetical protein QBC44DRAFT_314284 [Cladorrhinum sp. PSN332]